jgi:hypothetical protein
MLRPLAELFSLACQPAFLTQKRKRMREHAERRQKQLSAVLCAAETSLNPELNPEEPCRRWWTTVDVLGVARFGGWLPGIGPSAGSMLRWGSVYEVAYHHEPRLQYVTLAHHVKTYPLHETYFDQ